MGKGLMAELIPTSSGLITTRVADHPFGGWRIRNAQESDTPYNWTPWSRSLV